MGEIIPSKLLSRITYTGIKSMNSQKAKQPYIRSAKKEQNQKEETRGRRRPMKNPPEDIKKWALRIAEINRITKVRKA